MKIWLEKDTKFDGTFRYYIMTEGECLGSADNLEDATKKFKFAVDNYKVRQVEVIQEVEL